MCWLAVWKLLFFCLLVVSSTIPFPLPMSPVCSLMQSVVALHPTIVEKDANPHTENVAPRPQTPALSPPNLSLVTPAAALNSRDKRVRAVLSVTAARNMGIFKSTSVRSNRQNNTDIWNQILRQQQLLLRSLQLPEGLRILPRLACPFGSCRHDVDLCRCTLQAGVYLFCSDGDAQCGDEDGDANGDGD